MIKKHKHDESECDVDSDEEAHHMDDLKDLRLGLEEVNVSGLLALSELHQLSKMYKKLITQPQSLQCSLKLD